jgi:hypothetical protein
MVGEPRIIPIDERIPITMTGNSAVVSSKTAGRLQAN